MVSAYCLSYQNWTVIPYQMEADFNEMVSMGFDTVCLTFSESEMRYSRRAFEIQVKLARKAGLKVFVIPSRLGGRFAGAPLMISTWLALHPQHIVPGGWLPVACLESEEFRTWIKDFMKTIITDYQLDGIVWDEPKDVGLIDNHPESVLKFGQNPTYEMGVTGFLDFFDDLTSYCNSLQPNIIQTLFAQKGDDPLFTEKAVCLKNIQYFGYDGILSRQSYFKEAPVWTKNRLEDVWDRNVHECNLGSKKTFALVENMLMPNSVISEFEENFERYMQNYRPDHLSIYYYGHNNEDPQKVHDVVKRIMKQYLGVS